MHIRKVKTMKFKILSSIIAATLVLSGYPVVEARQAKPQPRTNTTVPARQSKPRTTKPVKSTWKRFTSRDGRFSVVLPFTPRKTTQTQKTHMGEIQIQSFIVAPPNQEVAYVVAYNDFPYSYGQEDNAQLILNDAQNLAVRTTDSKLVRQQNITWNGNPGRQLEYVKPGGIITKHRMYLVNGRLYQVMVTTTEEQQKTLSGSINGFLNSFRVTSNS